MSNKLQYYFENSFKFHGLISPVADFTKHDTSIFLNSFDTTPKICSFNSVTNFYETK